MTYPQSFKALAKIDPVSGDLIWGQVNNRPVYPEPTATPQLLSQNLTMDQLMQMSYCKDLLEEWQLVTMTISVDAEL